MKYIRGFAGLSIDVDIISGSTDSTGSSTRISHSSFTD